MDDFFISYNGADRQWAEWIGWTLEDAGLSVVVQAWDFRAGENFPLEMQKALTNSKQTLIVLSENFLRADYTQPEWAAVFARDPRAEQRALVPVRVGVCNPEGLLLPLIYIDLVGLSEDEARTALLEGLRPRGKPETAPQFPGRRRATGGTRSAEVSLAQKPFPGEASSSPDVWEEKFGFLRQQEALVIDREQRSAIRNQLAMAEQRLRELQTKVSLTHLPHASEFLEGRDELLARLEAIWNDPGVHVLTIVARGGEGKTNLVRHWLNRMSAGRWHGAELVFGWSFFSQGTNDKAASADEFIDKALRFFGEEHPESMKSPHERGDKLAQLVGARRALLFLDGLEPLQYPPGSMYGYLKDPALGTLVAGLSAQNAGLCIITTRVPLPELAAGKSNITPEIELPPLSDTAGAVLLERLGATRGTAAERESVARRLGGHAFSIQLMGTYLAEVYNGDIRRAGEVVLLDQDSPAGEQARQILETYERWLSGQLLAESDLTSQQRAAVQKQGARMLAVLRLLGLFDRPADLALLDVLRAGPAIPGLTEPLVGLSQGDWNRALSRLAQLKLTNQQTAGGTSAIDCHPLIREHFGARLKEETSEGAKEAHRRLYEYLKTSTVELPQTLAQMLPLLDAVVHGCKAGMPEQALMDVLWPRVHQKTAWYAGKRLGATGAMLGMYVAFFDPPWTRVVDGLDEASQRFVRADATYYLHALGRLSEAAGPAHVVFREFAAAGEWKKAAAQGSTVIEIALMRGDVAQALQASEHAVEYGERANEDLPYRSRARAGAALHAAGMLDAARRAFVDAEERAAAMYSHTPLLQNILNLTYCELLLDSVVDDPRDAENRTLVSPGEYLVEVRRVRERCAETLAWARARADIWLSSLGAECLASGLAAAAEAEFNLRHPNLILDANAIDAAVTFFDESLGFLRRAVIMPYLAAALIARAKVRLLPGAAGDGALRRADKDLSESEQIVRAGEMIPFLAEATILRGRLALLSADRDAARAKLDEARKLIEQTARPYVPAERVDPNWQPPPYLGAVRKGETIRYRRLDRHIAALARDLA